MTTLDELRQITRNMDSRARGLIVKRWVKRDDALLAEIIDSVVMSHGDALSVATAEWYDLDREMNGVGGRYRAESLRTRQSGAESLVGWARATALTPESMQSLVLGGVTKRIANASRLTISANAEADPRALGWQRRTSAGACLFCLMLADRGAVYKADTARFASHDDCRCSAVPAWDGKALRVKPFTGKRKGASEEDRARVREWLSANREYLETL